MLRRDLRPARSRAAGPGQPGSRPVQSAPRQQPGADQHVQSDHPDPDRPRQRSACLHPEHLQPGYLYNPGSLLRRRDRGLRCQRGDQLRSRQCLADLDHRLSRIFEPAGLGHRLHPGRYPLSRAGRICRCPRFRNLHAGNSPTRFAVRRSARLAGGRLLRQREAAGSRQSALRHPIRTIRRLPPCHRPSARAAFQSA